MDENTIFKADKQIDAPATNPIIAPIPEELPTSPVPSVFSKILKIFLGVSVVLIIIFFVFKLVLPKFLNTGNNKVRLVYWGLEREPSVMETIISDFEKLNPNIEIEYLKQEMEDYKEKLIARSNGGIGPDIFRLRNSWVPMLEDVLLPIPQNIISKEEFSKNYYPVASMDLIRNGAILSLPLQIDTLNLYINNDIFEAAGLTVPTTWIEFLNDARQSTVKDENNNIKTAGAALGTFDNVSHASDIISMFMVQNGVDVKNISENIDAASDALNFYTSFAMPPTNIWDNTLDSSVRMFAKGSLAMYFGYSSDFFTIKSLNPNLSFDIYPVPNLPGQSATIASFWAEGISNRTKHQKEALLFLKYLIQKETMQRLFAEESKIRNFGEPYARVDMADSLKNSIVYPFVASGPIAVSSLNSQTSNYMKDAIDSILSGTSPKSAAEILSQQASQALKQYDQ